MTAMAQRCRVGGSGRVARRLAVLAAVALVVGEPVWSRAGDGDAPEGAGAPSSSDKAVPQGAVAAPTERRFFAAVGEVLLLELIPWTFNRYVADADWARISTDTVRRNFREGLVYDPDNFGINQAGHPYHGSLFFEAARANGYGYYSSGAFALGGSLLWECCMETTAPSINDLVNTTLGGMARGEVSHRLAAVILDNGATGAGRLWREVGAALVNPVGSFNRLVRGETTEEGPNPEERFPSAFGLALDAGYRRIAGRVEHQDQAILSATARYGDPFAGDVARPFDTFWAAMDLTAAGESVIPRFEARGILKGWEWSEPDDPARHILGIFQEYEYLRNASQVTGAEMFSGGVLSRYTLPHGVVAATDVNLLLIPIAAVRVSELADPSTGRNYDYGPGAGVRLAARLHAQEREVASIMYRIEETRTTNGSSEGSRLQHLRAAGLVPITRRAGVGASYSWYDRETEYAGFDIRPQAQSEWRVYVDLTVGATGLRSPVN